MWWEQVKKLSVPLLENFRKKRKKEKKSTSSHAHTSFSELFPPLPSLSPSFFRQASPCLSLSNTLCVVVAAVALFARV